MSFVQSRKLVNNVVLSPISDQSPENFIFKYLNEELSFRASWANKPILFLSQSVSHDS